MSKPKSKVITVRVVGPLEPYAGQLMRLLVARGYRPLTRVPHLQVMTHLNKWMAARRQLQLDEPDTLLGDRIARTTIYEYRVEQGGQLMTSQYNDDALGLVDLWSRTGLPSSECHQSVPAVINTVNIATHFSSHTRLCRLCRLPLSESFQKQTVEKA